MKIDISLTFIISKDGKVSSFWTKPGGLYTQEEGMIFNIELNFFIKNSLKKYSRKWSC